MNTKNLMLWMAAPALFFACESEDNQPDITAPVITLEEPHMGDRFAAGVGMHVHGLATDNDELSMLNITVHDVLDGHSHGRRMDVFSYDQSFSMNGSQFEIDQHIDVPSEATAGPYHLILQATDVSGNVTSFADGSSIELEIWITNDGMAHVHFEDVNGAEVSEYEVEPGVALEFYGEVEDQGGIDHIEVIVGHLEGEDHVDEHDHGRILSEGSIYEGEFEVDGATLVSLNNLLADESIIVPQAEVDELAAGEYLHLIVQVLDMDGNMSRFSVPLHFH